MPDGGRPPPRGWSASPLAQSGVVTRQCVVDCRGRCHRPAPGIVSQKVNDIVDTIRAAVTGRAADRASTIVASAADGCGGFCWLRDHVVNVSVDLTAYPGLRSAELATTCRGDL